MQRSRERRTPTVENQKHTPRRPRIPVEHSRPPEPEEPAHSRYNFAVLVVDVSAFSIAASSFDLSAVLPLLLERLGANAPLIGAFAALRFLLFSALQIFIAYHLMGKARQKPFLAWAATLTRLPYLALPWFLWHANDSPAARSTALIATIILLSIWSLGDGLGYVPWMEIVARAFTERTRGRFFATTQLLSGLVSILVAGLVVRNVLHSTAFPFPHNYALLTLIAGVMFQVSTSGIWMVREPAPPQKMVRPHLPLFAYIQQLPALVRNNPIFGRLAVVQLLVGFGSASAPFYVLYATGRFHLGDEWGGTYQVMSAIGVVALMPAWAVLSERFGPAASVRGVTLACLCTPLIALTLGTLSPWLFGLVFLLMGGSIGWGMWIAMNHFLLTHISEEERPIFVALLNLLFLPSAIYPFLGGLLIQQKQFISVLGVPVLFVLTFCVIACGFLLALKLPTPSKE